MLGSIEEISAVNIDLMKISAFFRSNGMDYRELSCHLLQTSSAKYSMYQNPMKIILVPPRYRCLGTRENTMFHYVTKKYYVSLCYKQIICFIMLQLWSHLHSRQKETVSELPQIGTDGVTTCVKPWDQNFIGSLRILTLMKA